MNNLKEFKYESVQDVESIRKYLRALADGFESGELTFAQKDEEFTMHPDGLVSVQIQAKEKNARRKLTIKLAWKEQNNVEVPDVPLVVRAAQKDG